MSQLDKDVMPIDELSNPLCKLQTWQRLHFRLTVLYGGAVLISLIAMGVLMYNAGVKLEMQNTQQRLLTTVTSLSYLIDAGTFEAALKDSATEISFRKKLFDQFKQVAGKDPDIETIYILLPTTQPAQLQFLIDYAKDGVMAKPGEAYDASEVPVMLKGFREPVVEDKLYADEFGLTLSGYAPIKNAQQKSMAIVGADIKANRIGAMKVRVLVTTASVFFIAFVFISIISYFIAYRVRTPLTRIINATDAITHGQLDTRIRLERRDELGLMSQYFDKMAEGLQDREHIREVFGRYVSHDVAKAMLDKKEKTVLGGEERVVTVLFSDIEGYSTISEQLPPVKVVELINEYLGVMNQIIDTHKGCVIEYLGDAVFAVFGAPNYMADHCERAVRCAVDMRKKLMELNKQWQTSGLARYWKDSGIEHLKARIGIHSGKVVSGNLGSATRMKYSVIGDTVNVASRLENMNKTLGTEILISAEVRSQLPEEITRLMTDGGERRLKGREQGVHVYSI